MPHHSLRSRGLLACLLCSPVALAAQAPTSGLRPAEDDANHWGPTWSPDGRRIAFSGIDRAGGDDYELYVLTLATGEIRQLTDNTARDFRPHWSPRGDVIGFSSNRDGNDELYTLNVTTGAVRRLTNTPEREERMTWAPDGRRIIFDRTAGTDGEWDLWMLSLDDGATAVQLTRNPGFEGYPDWSPDGRSVVFNSNLHDPKGGAAAREIYRLQLASGQVTRLTTNTAFDQSPAWSPDGRQIAWFSQQDGNPEIYVMNADGSHPVRLTHNPEWDFMPAWSPDGSAIAFDSRRDGRRGIYLMAPDGSGVRKLTNLVLSPFIELVRSAGVDSALRAWGSAVAAAVGDRDDFFLEAEIPALARALQREAPLDALRVLEAGVEARPRSADTWMALGDLATTLGLGVTARRAYLQTLELDPSRQTALDRLRAMR